MQIDLVRSKRAGAWSVVFVLAALGCNSGGSGSSQKSGSTTNPPATNNSRTTTTPVTSNTAPTTTLSKTNAALKIVSATLDDTDGNHLASKGDVLTIRFSQPIKVTATSPTGEIDLLVFGDSFGTGATLAGVTTQTTDAIIVLGTSPKLKVTGAYSATATGSYQSSGLDVSTTVSGIKDANGLLPVAGVGVDVTSTKLTEGCFTVGMGMKFARGLHTATLLDDGTVLIAGGISATGPNTSNYQRENEIFDPLTGTCTALSSTLLGGTTGGYMLRTTKVGTTIKVGRYAHTANKLANGKVLIAGGNGFEDTDAAGALVYGPLASCYLYDPTTHKFTETGKLTKARRDHSAILIAGGQKVLVFGGRDASGTMGSSEIYDTATGTWSAGPAMATGRYDTAVVPTPTGAYVLGGATMSSTGVYTDVTQDELYDPTANTFAATPVALAPERHSHTATLLDTGDILLSGGYGSGAALTKILLFNRLLGQWLPAGDMKAARERHVATRIEGDVLASGGMIVDATGTVKTIDTVETMGPSGAMGSFPLGFGRLSHTATLLQDGRVVILGGFRNPSKDIRGMDGTSVAAVEVFVRP